MADGYNLGDAYGRIIIDDNVDAAIANAQRSFDRGITNIAQSMIGFGQRMEHMGRQITLAFAPITAFAAQGVLAFASFDEILVEIEARTGATGDEMERLRSVALEMGQNTAFSATQAADAMLQLLSSGYDLNETMQALEPTLNLAAAGNLELGYAADAVTDILAQFKLGAEDASNVSNDLAQAAGSSSATIGDLIDGFANVGPLASNFGLSVGDTAAILAVFSENGIKGAEAGTQLKSMLTQMVSDSGPAQETWAALGVSMFDANGEARDLNDVLLDLGVAMDGMSDQERIDTIQNLAGNYGQLGLSALLATGGFGDMADSMIDAAGAATLADAKMGSLRGGASQLGSSIETLGINIIGPFAEERLKPMVFGVIDLLNRFNEWLTLNPELASTLGDVLVGIAILGPTLVVVGRAVSMMGGMLSNLLGAFRMIGVAIGVVFSPLGAVIAAAIALGTALYLAWQTNFGGIQEIVGTVINFVTTGIADVSEWIGGLIDLLQAGDLQGAADGFLSGIGDLFNGLMNGLSDAATWVFENLIEPLASAVLNYVGSGQLWTDLQTLGASIMDGIAAGLAIAGDVATWVFNNIINPVVLSIQTYIGSGELFDNLSALGSSIFKAIGEGIRVVGDVATWVFTTLIEPLATAVISYVGSGQLWEDVKSLGESLLDALAAGVDLVSKAATWLQTNLVAPLASEISGGTTTSLVEVFMGLGGDLLDSILAGIGNIGQRLLSFFQEHGPAMVEAAGVVVETISFEIGRLPGRIIALLIGAIPEIAEAVVEYGPTILGGIILGLGSIAEFINENVVFPMVDGIFTGVADVFEAALALGVGILGGLAEGIGDILQWAVDNIIQPIIDGITSGEWIETLIGGAINLGISIVEALVNGLVGLAGAIRDALVAPVEAAFESINNSAADLLESLGLLNRERASGSAEGGGDSYSGGGQYGGGESGGEGQNKTGFGKAAIRDSGGPGEAGMIAHVGRTQQGNEAFILGDRGHFYPDFAKNLAAMAASMFSGGAAVGVAEGGLSGGNGGNTYHITVEVPADVLVNEPRMADFARNAGTAILREIRSRG